MIIIITDRVTPKKTQIENSLTSSSQFTVVDRSAMDAIIAELRRQHSGTFDESNQKSSIFLKLIFVSLFIKNIFSKKFLSNNSICL